VMQRTQFCILIIVFFFFFSGRRHATYTHAELPTDMQVALEYNATPGAKSGARTTSIRFMFCHHSSFRYPHLMAF
jgi:hypothetical protein